MLGCRHALRHLVEWSRADFSAGVAASGIGEAALRKRVEQREHGRRSRTEATQGDGRVGEHLLAELLGPFSAAGSAEEEAVNALAVSLERLRGEIRWLSSIVHGARSDPPLLLVLRMLPAVIASVQTIAVISARS